jgi:hypothetical protein
VVKVVEILSGRRVLILLVILKFQHKKITCCRDRRPDANVALPSILDNIIAAEGCTIREFSHINSTGRRYTKLSGAGPMKNKSQKRDRRETLVLRPCHPDLQPEIDALLRGEVTEDLFNNLATELAALDDVIDDRAAQGGDLDDTDQIGKVLGDEVRFMLVALATFNLTPFPPKWRIN